MNKTSIFAALQSDIVNSNMPESVKNKMLQNVLKLKEQEVNILITGATGCGKSSTINALFSINSGVMREVAKVGVGVDPETMQVQKYTLDNLILWDTPGLGDSVAADEQHAKVIADKLRERGKDGNALVDLVLVILDGSTKDLRTSYELINSVIIPNLGTGGSKRLLVAINQADVAMGGRNWDRVRNEPEPALVAYLEKKVESVKNRVKDATGVSVEPIYYCAGYKQENGTQERPYNLSKLLYYIVDATPPAKRSIYADNINCDPKMWQDDDKQQNYNARTIDNMWKSVVSGATIGANIGGAVGSLFGATGKLIGSWVGRIVGLIWGA